MDWLQYILILAGICAVYFIISRLWVGLVDAMINWFKKLFKTHNPQPQNWRTLEDISDQRKEKEKQ